MTPLESIRAERAAFEALLPTLQNYVGKYAIVQSGWLMDICDSESVAYAKGIEYFGPDEIFLVSKITVQVEEETVQILSPLRVE